MNWADERYVRLYTRDTITWKLIGWQGRCLLPLLLRKVDRSGCIELQGAGEALGGKRKAELAAKSNPEKPPAQPAKKREPRGAKPAATPRPEVNGEARPLQALVKACALAEFASGAGYQPPRPSNSCSSPEDRGAQLARSGSLAGAPGDRTALSKEPDAKPRTAAERVEEAAKARATQRQRLIERGTAWHERAAAHMQEQRERAAQAKEEGRHPSGGDSDHDSPRYPQLPAAQVATCTFPRSQP